MCKSDKNIVNMQKKIRLIRQVFNINTISFAEMIGVTRQTVYNIENQKTVLSKTQYLAICQVLSAFLEKYPERYDIIKSIWENGYDKSFESIKDDIIRLEQQDKTL